MADPLSITGFVLQIGVLVKQLYDYGKAVKSARTDISTLCTDLLALKGILQDLSSNHPSSSSSSPKLQDNLTLVLSKAQTLISSLISRLDPGETWQSRAKQSLKWPFDRVHVDEILTDLERIKTSLLLVLMGDHAAAFLDLGSIKGDISEIKTSVRTIAETVRTDGEERRRRELFEKLAPVSPVKAHAKARAVWRGSGSGSWFLDGPLREWLEGGKEKKKKKKEEEGGGRLMALCGISGAGKSTIISRAIEHVREGHRGEMAVAYFYCAYNEVATHEIGNILGSWLVQLAQAGDREDGSSEVWAKFGKYSSVDAEVPVEALQDALVAAAEKELGGILLVLDALNESTQSNRLVACISGLLRRSKRIRVLVSSTLPVEGIFSGLEVPYTRVNMANEMIDKDIMEYIKTMVRQHPILEQVGEDKILRAIVPEAKGMFRWAVCQMTVLSDYITVNMVRTALKRLPGTLDDIYVVLLQRVPVIFQNLVREALTWLAYSFRVLTLRELVEAIAIEVGDKNIDDSCRIQPPHRILELCQGLVVWDEDNDQVSLAHSSVAAFFKSEFVRKSPMSHFYVGHRTSSSIIIQKSLSYLLMNPFKRGNCDRKTLESLIEQYPLINYASCMWALHARDYSRAHGKLRRQDSDMILKFLHAHEPEPRGGHFTFWIRCLMPFTRSSVIQAATPLYYAASFGLTPIIELLFEQNIIELDDTQSPWYIDGRCGRGHSTPLGAASYRGHTGVVELLLAHGADPSSVDIRGNSPLAWARRMRYNAIVSLLRKQGAVEHGTLNSDADETEEYKVSDKNNDGDGNMAIPYTGLLEAQSMK